MARGGLFGQSGMLRLGMMAAEMFLMGKAAKSMGKSMIKPYIGRAALMAGGLVAGVFAGIFALGLGSAALFAWLLAAPMGVVGVLGGVAGVMVAVAGIAAWVVMQAKDVVDAYEEATKEAPAAPIFDGLREVEAEVEGFVGGLKSAFNRGWENVRN